MSNSYAEIALRFALAVPLGSLSVPVNCSFLFTPATLATLGGTGFCPSAGVSGGVLLTPRHTLGQTGAPPQCLFTSLSDLLVQLGHDATVRPNDVLELAPGTIFGVQEVIRAVVLPPVAPLLPQALILVRVALGTGRMNGHSHRFANPALCDSGSRHRRWWVIA